MAAELTEAEEEAIITAYLEQVGEADIEAICAHLEAERTRHCLEYLVEGGLVEAHGPGDERTYRLYAIAEKLTSPAYHRNWTRDDVAEAMRLYVRRHKRIPAGLDFSKKYGPRSANWPQAVERQRRDMEDDIRWPSYALVLQLFGSWNAALEEAGLPVHEPGRRPRWAHKHALRVVA